MKTNIKTICTIALCAMALIVTSPSNAQEKGKKGVAPKENAGQNEAIKSQKIAFLTQELSLTPEEAEKFWPVYNKADELLDQARRATRKAVFTLKKAIADQTKSDGEINELSVKIFSCIDKEAEVAKNAYTEYLKVLPTKKAAKVRLAEESFMHSLIHKLRRVQGKSTDTGAEAKQPQKAKR